MFWTLIRIRSRLPKARISLPRYFRLGQEPELRAGFPACRESANDWRLPCDVSAFIARSMEMKEEAAGSQMLKFVAPPVNRLFPVRIQLALWTVGLSVNPLGTSRSGGLTGLFEDCK